MVKKVPLGEKRSKTPTYGEKVGESPPPMHIVKKNSRGRGGGGDRLLLPPMRAPIAAHRNFCNGTSWASPKKAPH